MNLDDLERFRQIDADDMLSHIQGLPQQLQDAWHLGLKQPLPVVDQLQSIVIAGMGGSAIGADLLAAYVAPLCSVPVVVHRDYDLPAWASGPRTLVICSSHSGNTEETLSSFEVAKKKGCAILTLSTGGKLAEAARSAGLKPWIFEHHGMPRAAVGFSFGLLLALFSRLGLIPDASQELAEALQVMRQLQTSLDPEVMVVNNPAKRMAGQLVGRYVTIFGSGYLAPVSRRWKGQINEVAKAWGQFDFLPEGDHNTMAGLVYPAELLPKMMALFLRAPSDHPRNHLRANLTRNIFMQEGINTDFVDARGVSALAHIWSLLLFGDYTSYYLAMAYGVDPTPIDVLEGFKKAMLG